MGVRQKEKRSLAVMMSKRANVFYLEHVRVMQKGGRVVYLNDTGQPVEQYVNIPDKNTSFILLGKGTSITDAAIRLLAESNVIVGFTGSGGTPLLHLTDQIFLVPHDEYRPTEYMQNWARRWFDEPTRLAMGKAFLKKRANLDKTYYRKSGLAIQDPLIDDFQSRIDSATSTTHLLSAEGWFVARLYGNLAKHYGIEFKRDADSADPKKMKSEKIADRINRFLSHGNYLAYGYAAVTLHTLGISYAFPVLHGKTRRGALVFDVADLIKDWIVLPTAFKAGLEKWSDQDFRRAIIDLAINEEILDIMIDFVKEVSLTPIENQQVIE